MSWATPRVHCVRSLTYWRVGSRLNLLSPFVLNLTPWERSLQASSLPAEWWGPASPAEVLPAFPISSGSLTSKKSQPWSQPLIPSTTWNMTHKWMKLFPNSSSWHSSPAPGPRCSTLEADSSQIKTYCFWLALLPSLPKRKFPWFGYPSQCRVFSIMA